MPVIFMGIVLSAPTTAYANSGGTGNRTASITVTTNITPDSGTPGSLVDGTTSGAAGWDMPGTGSTAIPTDAYIKFDFGSGVKKYIDEFKLYWRTGTPSMGSWVFQCSNDDVSYTTVATFTWNSPSPSQSVTCTGIDPEGFRYWKMAKNGAGNNYSNDYWQEIEFKIAAGAT